MHFVQTELPGQSRPQVTAAVTQRRLGPFPPLALSLHSHAYPSLQVDRLFFAGYFLPIPYRSLLFPYVTSCTGRGKGPDRLE